MADSGGGPFLGLAGLTDPGSDFTVMQFIARMMMLKTWTGIPVLVKAIRNGGAGAVALAGVVDVQPMVHQVDGQGQPTPHDTIFGVPYFRLQGGVNAIILDPAVGDIGWCLFAQRDISTVKANLSPSTPGSSRTFDPSDGFYLGGLLNGVPQQIIRFAAGIYEQSPVVTATGNMKVGAGATGAFGTSTGQVVTVQDGIITNIA